ncbi:prepilin-type N-terminal cleavage/methylation domain-containing protein [Planctomycetota bacterium]
MKSRKGFTLVELMVVVVIVALLAALLIPMLTARIEAAKWSEGKAGAGTIATALRAYAIEKAELEPGGGTGPITLTNGIEDFMNPADLHGKYFDYIDYSITNIAYNPGNVGTTDYVITYTITVAKPDTSWTKGPYSLDHLGQWTEGGGT